MNEPFRTAHAHRRTGIRERGTSRSDAGTLADSGVASELRAPVRPKAPEKIFIFGSK